MESRRWRALKNETTKLDKIYRSVSYPSQMQFCEGLSLCVMICFPFNQGAMQCNLQRIVLIDTWEIVDRGLATSAS